MPVSQGAIRSYFSDGWLLRLFRSCSDREVDEAFEAWALSHLLPMACRALNVEEADLTRPSDIVWGYPRSNLTIEVKDKKGKVKSEFPYLERQGRDKKYRGSSRLMAVIMYGQDQLMAFRLVYNAIGQVYTRPLTSEYFYQDIVSVETNEDSFVLTSSGATKIEIPLVGSDHNKQIGDRDRAENTVRNVRAMLRQRKSIRQL